MMETLLRTMEKRTGPYITVEQTNDENFIKLNTSENPYPPSPRVIDAITADLGSNLRLYPSPTIDTLREKIANYYEVAKDNVFVGNGSDEVLAFSFMAFFEPERRMKFPNVTYSFYPFYAKLFDIPYEKVPLRDDLKLLEEQFFDSDWGVIFPNPNAPTSLYLPLTEIEKIAANNKEKIVIVDEAYIDFASESAVSLTKQYDNVLVIQTMSKSRALAGLRVGLEIGNESLTMAHIHMKDSFNS